MESVEIIEVERYLPTVVIDVDNNESDHIDQIITKFQNHPSILKINENVKVKKRFEFRDVTEDEMFKKIIELDPKKHV